jgi:hypothetical protein
MSAEYRGFTKGDFSGGGGGEGLGPGRRFRARISLITRILVIKKPKEMATLLILNIISLYVKKIKYRHIREKDKIPAGFNMDISPT